MIFTPFAFMALYDVNAQAFFQAVENGGDSLTVTEKEAVNTFVTTLKSDGIWDKMQVIYPIVGGTSSSVKWNLKDPRDLDAAYRMDVVGAGWTINSTGMKQSFSDTTYGDTHYAPNTNNNTVGLHMALYVNGGTNAEGYDLASNKNGVENRLIHGFGNDVLDGTLETGGSEPPEPGSFTMPLAFSIITGNGSGQQLYRNGTLAAATATARGFTSDLELYLGQRNVNTAIDVYSSDRKYAFVSMGEYLDSTDSSNLSTAVETFQTTLNRENP